MKILIEWLEIEKTRLRKILAIFTAMLWLIAVIVSYVLTYYNLDTIAILSLVTAQFSTVIGFYMATKAEND